MPYHTSNTKDRYKVRKNVVFCGRWNFLASHVIVMKTFSTIFVAKFFIWPNTSSVSIVIVTVTNQKCSFAIHHAASDQIDHKFFFTIWLNWVFFSRHDVPFARSSFLSLFLNMINFFFRFPTFLNLINRIATTTALCSLSQSWLGENKLLRTYLLKKR